MDAELLNREVVLLSEEVGAFIRRELQDFDRNKVELKGKSDMVSYVDKEAEKQIVERLRELLPEAGFIAEEGTGEPKPGGYNWIIDPLDGTTNFVHGIPIFSVSIALMKADELIAGVVHEPSSGETFHAVRGKGAFLDGKPIGISPARKLSESLIATGFPYKLMDKMDDFLKLLYQFIKHSHGFRRLGSAAVDLCYVAAGRFEAFYEHGLNPWDVAAGALIVQEAGGKVTDMRGGNNYIFGGEILAAGHVHEQMQTVIREHFLDVDKT